MTPLQLTNPDTALKKLGVVASVAVFTALASVASADEQLSASKRTATRCFKQLRCRPRADLTNVVSSPPPETQGNIVSLLELVNANVYVPSKTLLYRCTAAKRQPSLTWAFLPSSASSCHWPLPCSATSLSSPFARHRRRRASGTGLTRTCAPRFKTNTSQTLGCDAAPRRAAACRLALCVPPCETKSIACAPTGR